MDVRLWGSQVKRGQEVLVPRSCPTLRPHGLQPTRLLCPWSSPGDLPNPGIEPGSLTLQADCTSEPPGTLQERWGWPQRGSWGGVLGWGDVCVLIVGAATQSHVYVRAHKAVRCKEWILPRGNKAFHAFRDSASKPCRLYCIPRVFLLPLYQRQLTKSNRRKSKVRL